MLLLGIDAGSSSVKASVIEGLTGETTASAFYPKQEMKIMAVKAGRAEQDPETWWDNMKLAVNDCTKQLGERKKEIGAVGISYQMHGLVAVDSSQKVLRPSIIWCDSRAVDYGQKAFEKMGKGFCLSHLLNSPGNFTAAKLAWVKENEPKLYDSIYKIMLPGDYIAMRLTGEIMTTFTGLSEGIFWDFTTNSISEELLNAFGFDKSILPDAVPSFSEQGTVLKSAAEELGIPAGIPVAYRAGDQPNNALSLNVLNPGEVAATAGTSGVIYGVTDQKKSDPLSRVNTFIHVNHSTERQRLGVLLCINGTGILNAWLKHNIVSGMTYDDMNHEAEKINPGSDGVVILPFGNGAERILQNRDTGCSVYNLNFNRHSYGHLLRAAQEGIAFSFRYGLDIMKKTGIVPSMIKAGKANMFISPVFRETLSCITDSEIKLYNTDGSAGAARGAGIGCKYYTSADEAFSGLKEIGSTLPDNSKKQAYSEAYSLWLKQLTNSEPDK